MVKRKMPAHIVLPNGMWRFVKSGSKKAKAAVKRVKHRKVKRKRTRRGVQMAKRRHSKRSSSGFGGKGIMKGLYTPKGIAASMLMGAGAATLAEKVLPNFIPMQNLAIGFVVGGVGGAAGVIARDALKGGLNLGLGSSSTASSGY